MIWLFLILLIIVFLEFGAYLIYRGHKDIKEQLKILLKKEQKGDIRTLTSQYVPHPFLTFSLNPDFRNSFGEKIHNKYGFRQDDDFTELSSKTVIYCVGASSTYCNFIDRNKDTWPVLLEKKLQEELHNDDIKVINAGCGGWNTYQSLIRFVAWVDVLKPKLVIVYDGKNDFSTFINARQSISEVFPDYGNIVCSLRFDFFVRNLSALSKYTYVGKLLYGIYVNTKYYSIARHVYNMKESLTIKEAEERLKRIGSREWDSIFSRFRSFAALCAYRNIKILFITQKVINHIFDPYMTVLNEKIKSLESRAQGCFVYDFDNDVSNPQDLLLDQVHFNQHGAKFFSERVKNFIIQNTSLLEI